MNDGSLEFVTEIFFGESQFPRLSDLIRRHGDRALIVTGSNSYVSSGAKALIEPLLANAGVTTIHLRGVRPDPTSDLVYEGAALCKSHGINVILAVGGGSVIDTAKAIGIAAADDGDFFDFFLRSRSPQRSIPVGCVLTIAGAGSESSDGCVIQRGIQKYSTGAPFMRPKFAFINVELMMSVEESQIRYGIADSLSHVLERYFTATEHVATTSYISAALAKAIMTLGPDVINNPLDKSIRADLVWAQKLAHDETGGFGRKGDWATHTLAHEVAVLTHAPHGEILSILFPSWLKFIKPIKPRLFEFLDRELKGLGTAQGGCDSLQKLIEFYAAICPIRRNLSQLGVKESHILMIAERAAMTTKSGTIGNLIRLGQDEMKRVLTDALH